MSCRRCHSIVCDCNPGEVPNFKCLYGRSEQDCCKTYPCSMETPPHPEDCPGCLGAKTEAQCAAEVAALSESYDFSEERDALLVQLLSDREFEGWQQSLVDEFVDYAINSIVAGSVTRHEHAAITAEIREEGMERELRALRTVENLANKVVPALACLREMSTLLSHAKAQDEITYDWNGAASKAISEAVKLMEDFAK